MDQTSVSDTNGRRRTAGLPFAANPSNSQPSNSQPLNSQQLNQPRDVYATRIGDEFDDVLDIPRPAQQAYQTSYDSSPAFDDVFATPGYESTESYDFSPPERNPTTPMEAFQMGNSRQRETQDYVAAAEPEFMGWPVLPENSIEEEEQVSGFSAGRGGLLARIVLCALVFGGLVFGAYYFLGDLISKRKSQEENLAKNNDATANQSAGNQSSANPPATAPSVEVKSAELPKTADTPPVVAPKTQDDNSQSGNAAVAKDDQGASKPVPIPPTVVGRTGPSESPRPAPAQATDALKGNWTIQVASFNDQAQANDRAARLKSAGVDARVVRAEIPGKGTWYRVYIGSAGTRQEAVGYGNQLKAKNLIQDFIPASTGK